MLRHPQEAAAQLRQASETGTDSSQLSSAIADAKQAGVQQKKLTKAEVQLQLMETEEEVRRAMEAKDVEALRNVMRRARRLGLDVAGESGQAQKLLEVLEAEEMLQIAMRNNVTGHLKKCIDIAAFKGANETLIAEARALYNKSGIERTLISALNSGNCEKLEASLPDAKEAGVTGELLEEAQEFLTAFNEKKAKPEKKESPKDQLEDALQLAIRMQQTGALQRAVKRARAADEKNQRHDDTKNLPTHEASICEAEQLIAELEIGMQLPLALKRQDSKKIKEVLDKAHTWNIETAEIQEANAMHAQLEVGEELRLAVNAKNKEQLDAAIEKAIATGVDASKIQKAELALAQCRAREEIRMAIEESNFELLEAAVQGARAVNLPRSEVEKAETTAKTLRKRQLVQA